MFYFKTRKFEMMIDFSKLLIAICVVAELLNKSS